MAFSIEDLLAESVYDTSIAVLLSSYNGEQYIKDQLYSVLDQDVTSDVVIYVRDDGSTDGTVAAIEEMMEENENIRLTKGEHIGRTASYFELLRNAGEHNYYALCDQDDYWLPRKLQDAVQGIEGANETDLRPLLFCSRSALVDGSMEPVGLETPRAGKSISFLQLFAQDLLPWANMVMNTPMRGLLLSESDDVLEEVTDPSQWISALAAVRGRILFNNRMTTFTRQSKSSAQALFSSGNHGLSKERLELLHYFTDIHADDISEDDREEVRKMFAAKTFSERFAFIRSTKITGQTAADTRRFKRQFLLRGVR